MSKLKPCSIRGVDYPSHAAAAVALGLTRQRIHQLAAQPLNGCKIRTGSKPVTIGGVSYPSTAQAAAALSVSYWVARYLARLGTATRRRKRPPASSDAKTKTDQPPMRNAIKILRRMVVILDSSCWIRRLPELHKHEIVKARRILQHQADLLSERRSQEPCG